MHVENAEVTQHEIYRGRYRLLTLGSPRIAPEVKPGQFVHVRVPHMNEAVLRRPFSVFRVSGERLSILYKDVGRGTTTMKTLQAGECVSLVGPLGHGFPTTCEPAVLPVLVAGGYGMAALYMVAQQLPVRGVAFFGGASAEDILCVDMFEALGWDVRITTEDGTLGVRGIVTDAVDRWLREDRGNRAIAFYACGPNGMLRAIGDRAISTGSTGWLSMDRNMGCGVGACLTCVVKVRRGESDWAWVRSCREGPVLECREIIWDE